MDLGVFRLRPGLEFYYVLALGRYQARVIKLRETLAGVVAIIAQRCWTIFSTHVFSMTVALGKVQDQ